MHQPRHHHVDTVHRLAAGLVGAALVIFGLAGALLAMTIGATSGVVIGGVFTNTLLSVLSIATGTALAAAAIHGARSASTALVVAGPLFITSGMVNAVLIGTPLNMIGFQASDVIFSWTIGGLLVLLGSYGRFTGALPADSPYARTMIRPTTPSPIGPAGDPAAARLLARAERAVAAGTATADQSARVAAAGHFRTHHDRVAAFTAADDRLARGVS